MAKVGRKEVLSLKQKKQIDSLWKVKTDKELSSLLKVSESTILRYRKRNNYLKTELIKSGEIKPTYRKNGGSYQQQYTLAKELGYRNVAQAFKEMGKNNFMELLYAKNNSKDKK